MNIDIICPLYNGKKYLSHLHKSLLKQKNVNLHEVHYILTSTEDGTEDVLNTLKQCSYQIISPAEFSHSLTREQAAFASKADILVFITQDVQIIRDDWLSELVNPIINSECEASYSRQICTNHTIERYTREKNYPAVSFTKSKEDLTVMGFRTFFYSDASSAIKRDIFVQLNGYDHKNFPSNEDTYIGYKLIMNGYRIRYCAASEVIHSHVFTWKQMYQRYYATGQFFHMEPEIEKQKANSAGAGLAGYILKRAFQEHNFSAILSFVPNMTARYLGLKAGEKA